MRAKKDKEKELDGIDTSNVIEGGRRRGGFTPRIYPSGSRDQIIRSLFFFLFPVSTHVKGVMGFSY